MISRGHPPVLAHDGNNAWIRCQPVQQLEGGGWCWAEPRLLPALVPPKGVRACRAVITTPQLTQNCKPTQKWAPRVCVPVSFPVKLSSQLLWCPIQSKLID